MNSINIYKGSLELCAGFTEFILKIMENKEIVNISLSGGSTPKALFDFWSEKEKHTMPWEKMRFFWGDERCVGPQDSMSNFNMTNQRLFSRVSVPARNIFRILGENDPKEEVERYGKILAQELEHKNGAPQFDVMILGLGDDGHTASIFPHQIGLWDSSEYCVVAEHPESRMKRISLTGKIINNAVYVAFLVTGKNKASKIYDVVLEANKYKETYPAARVKPLSGNLFWFLDTEAAALVK